MTSHLPEDFEARLQEILPGQKINFGPRPWQSFRINTLKTGIDDALGLIARQGIAFQRVDFCPYAILIKRGEHDLSAFIDQGLLYAQGLESLLPVMVLDPKPHEQVLDLCAAPGSKTSQIAMLMNNQGILKANEPVRPRLYKLKSVLAVTGARAQVSSVDGRRLRTGTFDRILVDAPCSSEGRFVSSEPKSFAYWSVRKIKEMSHKQKGLLLAASRLLSPGGTMVYSTCTFAPEENEEVVDWFLRKTDGRFELASIDLQGIKTYPCLGRWQKREYDGRIQQAVRILPDERMEGFFIAKFVNSYYK